jgi:hypothetical protein
MFDGICSVESINTTHTEVGIAHSLDFQCVVQQAISKVGEKVLIAEELDACRFYVTSDIGSCDVKDRGDVVLIYH